MGPGQKGHCPCGQRASPYWELSTRHRMLEECWCPSTLCHVEGCPKVPTADRRTDSRLLSKRLKSRAAPHTHWCPTALGDSGSASPTRATPGAARKSLCRDQTTKKKYWGGISHPLVSHTAFLSPSQQDLKPWREGLSDPLSQQLHWANQLVESLWDLPCASAWSLQGNPQGCGTEVLASSS